MSFLSILQVREGAHPLYVVYQNREKWGEDYSGEILVEHDKYLVITPEEKRFFFYYNVKLDYKLIIELYTVFKLPNMV